MLARWFFFLGLKNIRRNLSRRKIFDSIRFHLIWSWKYFTSIRFLLKKKKKKYLLIHSTLLRSALICSFQLFSSITPNIFLSKIILSKHSNLFSLPHFLCRTWTFIYKICFIFLNLWIFSRLIDKFPLFFVVKVIKFEF